MSKFPPVRTDVGKIRDGRERFFAYARERHSTYLRRDTGVARPWTPDPILREYRFTNVFRELDKVTVWFRVNVRDRLGDQPEVLPATVLFRMFNRIDTGEALFCQPEMGSNETTFERWLRAPSYRTLVSDIKKFCGKGPYVTGAYIISSPPGYPKLEGVARVVTEFAKSPWQEMARCMEGGGGISHGMSLRDAWEQLRDFDYFGPFHSYEIVTDLRHTSLLEHASDVDTWASSGPGCRRGLNRVLGREIDSRWEDGEILHHMSSLLERSRSPDHWPQPGNTEQYVSRHTLPGALLVGPWPRWEMREVEHTLCEFDKYERVRLGEGRPRGVFR